MLGRYIKNTWVKKLINKYKICIGNIKHIEKNKIDIGLENDKVKYVCKSSNNEQLIVSLTSYPSRLTDIKYTLYSLFNQTLMPNRIILYLTFEEFPNGKKDLPLDVIYFEKYGLEIKWCRNLRAYNKLIPALKSFPNSIIVTVDDDIYYRPDTLEILYKTHVEYPRDIIAHRAWNIEIDKNNIKAYDRWTNGRCGTASYQNFLTGVGSVLYPTNAFGKEIFNESVFCEITPLSDDIWFWGMAVLFETKIRIPDKCYNELIYVNPEKELSLVNTLAAENVLGKKNDKQLSAFLDKYSIVRKRIIC